MRESPEHITDGTTMYAVLQRTEKEAAIGAPVDRDLGGIVANVKVAILAVVDDEFVAANRAGRAKHALILERKAHERFGIDLCRRCGRGRGRGCGDSRSSSSRCRGGSVVDCMIVCWWRWWRCGCGWRRCCGLGRRRRRVGSGLV